MTDPLRALRETVRSVAEGSFERPRRAGQGDYSTNAALLSRTDPAQLAERLRERLGAGVERIEIAGPGFVNLFMADEWLVSALDAEPEPPTPGERVNVEYVSANPTGPLTAASGRHAAYGDAVSRLLAFTGSGVTREYYFNDAGSQITRLGESVRARARHEPVPEDGYQGAYVAELAAELGDGEPEELGRRAAALLMNRIRATLDAYRCDFDVFFLEGALYDGAIERTFERLREHTYEHDGALWLRTTRFGDDKDRVLRRSTGAPTYFAADIAYHADKLERGFTRLIDVLGSDHHGHVASLKAALAMLGFGGLEMPLLQFVHVVESGGRKGMSKRRGDFVTLDELIAEIGVDVTRYFMLSRSHESTIDLDLDLARNQTDENPVFYVQYAHARIASILRQADAAPGGSPPALEPAERELIKKLIEFPAEVEEAAERRSPHRIAAYALELAQAFTGFYRDCPVLKAEGETRGFRLALCGSTQRTLATALDLLGISAPESMEVRRS